jgi:dihydroorotate dehydrogenase (NAD+) catalytic subunit
MADQTLLNRTDPRTEGAELLAGAPAAAAARSCRVSGEHHRAGAGSQRLPGICSARAGTQLAGLEVYITVPPGGSGRCDGPLVRGRPIEAVRNELGDDAAVIVKLPPWPDHYPGLILGRRKAEPPPWRPPTP